MTELLNEIIEHFMTFKMGARPLEGFDKQKLTITLKHPEYYGVGILNVNNVQVNEKFANVRLENKTFNINGEENPFLVLSSTLYEHKSSFARLCEEFCNLGKDDFNRNLITTEPIKWWEKWKDLLGNVSTNKTPYSVIGELLIYKQELEKKHENVTWEGPKAKNHDIEGDEYHIEVKSTLLQYANEVTISSQFQLDGNYDLYLVLLKMQESSDGISINSLVDQIISYGVDVDGVEIKLGALGMAHGSNVREKKFRVVEGRKYKIDESFPVINAESFKGDQVPRYVKKINYTIDLSSFEYDTIEFD